MLEKIKELLGEELAGQVEAPSRAKARTAGTSIW